MAGATSAKLNINSLSVPYAFLGKARDKEYGSENFTPKNGGRLLGSDIFTLALMHTENVMFGSLNTMPYSAFTDELYCSRPTVCDSLKRLINEGITKKLRQSKYEILSEFSSDKTITVYSFLIEETFNLGGAVRRLTKNEILYASIVIGFYLKEENKNKNFIGGTSRVASAIKVSKSTAYYIVKRLIATKIFFRKSLTKDSAGNSMVTTGKGKSSKDLTVYEVNPEILRRCSAIEKERKEQRAVKAIFGQNVKKPKKNDKPVTGNVDYSKYRTAEDKNTGADFEKLLTAFYNDSTFQNIVKRYKKLYVAFLDALRSASSTDETEKEIDSTIDDLQSYLIKSGVPPEKIPDNLSVYIK